MVLGGLEAGRLGATGGGVRLPWPYSQKRPSRIEPTAVLILTCGLGAYIGGGPRPNCGGGGVRVGWGADGRNARVPLAYHPNESRYLASSVISLSD